MWNYFFWKTQTFFIGDGYSRSDRHDVFYHTENIMIEKLLPLSIREKCHDIVIEVKLFPSLCFGYDRKRSIGERRDLKQRKFKIERHRGTVLGRNY